MIDKFMKRFALALMVCIGMICTTGYGNITPDPADNSTATVENTTMDNVMMVPAIQLEYFMEVGTFTHFDGTPYKMTVFSANGPSGTIQLEYFMEVGTCNWAYTPIPRVEGFRSKFWSNHLKQIKRMPWPQGYYLKFPKPNIGISAT